MTLSGCWEASDIDFVLHTAGRLEINADGTIKIDGVSDRDLPLTITVVFHDGILNGAGAVTIFVKTGGGPGAGYEFPVDGPDCDTTPTPTATSSPTPCPDRDDDDVCNSNDNCPAWPNPAQKWPRWRVPNNDSDCDGFSDDIESYMTTDPFRHCAVDTTPDNETGNDGWPLDADDNGLATIIDVGNFVFVLNVHSSDPDFNSRFDYDRNGVISTKDVGLYVFHLNKGCSPRGE